MTIGGIEVTCEQAVQALEALEAAGGIMVRQVLAAAGNPLAACDYHAAAEPFTDRCFHDAGEWGRGAAGRPVTKAAFMAALRSALDQAAELEPARQFAPDLQQAIKAFSSDSGYAAAMARAAVAVREREHLGQLKTVLSRAAHQAVSACEARRGEFACPVATACGTGDCRFAGGLLAQITAPAGPGRLARPGNHARAGSGFGTGPALAQLERLAPFTVTVRMSSADSATGRDAVAA